MLLCSSYSNAQVDSTTGNLINYGTSATDTTSKWNNGIYVNSLTCWQPGGPGNCGPYPNVNQNSGAINFSYGQVDLNQVVNINRALAAGGSGVQLSGFNFAFTAKNGNGWDNGQQDYLSAYVKFYNAGGGVAATYDYTSQTNRKYNWTNFNFNETFANPVAASNYSNAQVGFVGRDTNGWAGPYGPEIINVNFALKYRVDPCSLNPAYSPTCSGFSSIVTSGNLVNSNLMSNGDIVYNSFAVNTALKNSGAGVDVYGFKYGYNYSLGNGTFGCTATNQDGSCSWYMTTNPNAQVRVRLTDNNNDVIYSAAQSRSTPNTAENVSYQFLLPKTTNSLSLGTFTMGASTSGNAAIQNMFVNALYKPDPCVDPLSSPSCPGYATAYAKNLILGSTVAAASAPAVAAAAPAVAQTAPALADPSPAAASPATAQAPAQSSPAPAAAQDPNQNPSVAQDNPAQPSPQSAGPTPTTPQPAGGPPQTATASAPAPSSGPQQAGPASGGSGPSKLAMSVVKSAQARDQVTQQIAVQNAAKVVEGSTQQSQATATAAIASLNDMSANSATAAAQFSSQSTQASVGTAQSAQSPQVVSTQQQSAGTFARQFIQTVNNQTNQTTTSQNDQTTDVKSLAGPQQVQSAQENLQTAANNSASITPLQAPQRNQETQIASIASYGSTVQSQPAYTPPPQQSVAATVTEALRPPVAATADVAPPANTGTGLVVRNNPYGFNLYSLVNTASAQQPPAPPAPVYQIRTETRLTEIETPPVQMASFGSGRAGNPLADLMQQRFEMLQTNIEQRSETVKRDVQPNELAGGVDLASMATQPKGFEAYSFTIRDSVFYEPKEVYRGQVVVDNVRALRQMSSDRLHKEMVDSQYKQGE